MDSGNSGGSMQSSSGGDEEFDSRAPESVMLPSFLNPSAHFVGSLSSSNPHHHHSSLLPHHQQLTFFDPSPNLFHPFSPSPTNPNPNSYLLRGLRSDPDCTDLSSNLSGSSSSQSVMGAHGSNHQGHLPSMQLRSVPDSCNNNNGARSSSPSDQTHVVARNPKKRTRASRRAPTTVLTTDTSNFRAMVQEFTGIPAPPFSGSPYSRRLDLFGSVGSGMRSGGHLEPIGSLYPLRPSAQKVHQQPPFLFSSSSSSSSSSSFLSSNTMVDATNTTTTATTTTSSNDTITLSIPSTTSTFNPSSVNYQLPSDLGLPKQQPQTMINMQNQMLSFQSLLQPPPPLHPSLDEVGMRLSGLPGQGTTQGMRLRINDNSSSSWRDGNNGNGNQDHQLRSLDSCKLNYSASSSEFHQHEKGLENVPSRGEGTVDSWICPSE